MSYPSNTISSAREHIQFTSRHMDISENEKDALLGIIGLYP